MAYTDYTWITDRLAVGGYVEKLEDLPFDAILSLEVFAPMGLSRWIGSGSVDYRWCPLQDDAHLNAHEEIVRQLNDAADIIDEWLRGGKRVLVHCQTGVSRSVAAVVQYLVRYQGYDWDAALDLVRSKRPRAKPNLGFEVAMRLSNGERLTEEWLDERIAAYCPGTLDLDGNQVTPGWVRAGLEAQGTLAASLSGSE